MVEFDAEPEHINVSFYDNQSILELLDDLSKTDEQQCKWINVNGLSWDVISALGKAKQFHRLAIEDVLSRKNRTKADWYPDQAYSKFVQTGTRHVSCLLTIQSSSPSRN